MSRRLRRYAELHGSAEPLPVLAEAAARTGREPDAAEVAALAARAGLPPAAVRAALSFYGELHAEPGTVRVCEGTSCALSGGDRLISVAAARGPVRGVYCLGYCDRSPALLLPDGRVAARCPPDHPPAPGDEVAEPPPTDVRCAAPEPIVTRNLLESDQTGLAAARLAGAWRALERALAGPPEAVLAAVEESGVRGRGGAAFPAGVKWRRCAETTAEERFAIANGDEGDPGSFIDRLLMEHDPHTLLEGLALCGYAVGARRGIVFVRSEYPAAQRRLARAVEEARAAGLLGRAILGSGFDFEVEVFPGYGSYVCGEETALLNALEGLRGEVRLRPPYPAVEGLHGRPTVVNNVETLVNVPWIVERGAAAYRRLGTADCPGTKALCLSREFARPGVVEVEFGVSLAEVIEELAGGGRGGGLAAVLAGGPMGSVLFPGEWDIPVCYTEMAKRGVQLGHGGLVAVPQGTDLGMLLRHWLTFMARESCGRCVPCALGSRRALAIAEAGLGRSNGGGDGFGEGARVELAGLFELMSGASLCAFGRLLPAPMGRLLERLTAGSGEASR